MAMMEETIDSLHQHGFSKFLIVNSHGGNNPPISVLLQKFMQDKKYDERGMQAEIYMRFAWAGDLDGPGMRTLGGAVRQLTHTTHHTLSVGRGWLFRAPAMRARRRRA